MLACTLQPVPGYKRMQLYSELAEEFCILSGMPCPSEHCGLPLELLPQCAHFRSSEA